MSSWHYYVFDFDSTFIQVEALEELAAISLANHPEKESRLQSIALLTNKGIDGTISFHEGLKERLDLIDAHKNHLPVLIERLKSKVSGSISRNKAFFDKHAERIYIISAGFREFIIPIVASYGIDAARVYANTFRFDEEDRITGFDEENPLSTTEGKLIQLRDLHLDGEVHVLGDGYSDSRMKFSQEGVKFFAFTENVIRDRALEVADHVVPSFDEFLYYNKLPMTISYPKNRIKVLLLENIHENAENWFLEEGYQVERLTYSPSPEELKERIREISILGIRSKTHITQEILDVADRLICLGAFCIGTNQINLDAALLKGVPVFNAPYSNTRSVVELVIGEIIMLMRRIPDKNRFMHEGKWRKTSQGSHEIRGKNLGIIGYGNIGAQLSVLAEALGMNVCYYDRVDKLALGNARKMSSMKEVLEQSDIVTLHVDGDPLNKNLFGKAELEQMKPGALLLNLARGFVIDLEAMTEALRSGKLGGAAIDVFPVEPQSNTADFQTELGNMENVILTPHIGGSTLEAQVDIAAFVPDKIVKYVNTGNTFSSVNFPNLQLPEQDNAHRLIHIHRNTPGILAKINTVLAKHNTNILGQYLKTNEQLGYVITDINHQYDKQLIKDLKEIEHTIKFRTLY